MVKGLDVQDVCNLRLFNAIKGLSDEAYKDLLVKAEFNRDRGLMQMCLDAKPFRKKGTSRVVMVEKVPHPRRWVG